MSLLIFLLLAVVGGLVLGYFGAPLWAWTVAAAVLALSIDGAAWLFVPLALVTLVAHVPPIRRQLITGPLVRELERRRLLPRISDTERVALDAGTVWVDGELFSGKPDWERILAEDYPDLTDEERRFLDGPVEEICALVDDWETYRNQDLSPEVWDALKARKFFAMIIPREHGGLGFSARAHAAVVAKLASRSVPLAVTAMVPNSLGPAELLAHYGTPEQKKTYLPRLASGEEMPCFALTEAGAGSDAGAMAATGHVFREGEELRICLNWSKRYITLAPVATLIGLAFKLEDPDDLLGQGTSPGITCALVPADAPGVVAGRRHDPLGIPFTNGPVDGEDVVISVDQVIGGAAGVGQGWRMLMETLAAGRGISLPALAVGSAKHVSRVAGAHAAVRQQFGLPIARFEGVGEALARIAGTTWMMEAVQVFTCGAIDGGAKPSVITAIAKQQETELGRAVVRDGMDVLGGAGIVRGPRNQLANLHVGQPISITVEGANILTRSMIIFGQGAIRCHPHALQEMESLARRDVDAFDGALWAHVRFVLRNACRALVLGVTRGAVATAPVAADHRRYYQLLSWASATFAVLADLAMGTLGGQLKRREMLTGRFADVLSWLYVGTACLRRFEAEGRRRPDRDFLHWSLERVLAELQSAFLGILSNFPVPVLGPILAGPAAAWFRLNPFGTGPSDRLTARVADAVSSPGAGRDRLVAGTFVASDGEDALARLERAFDLSAQADPIRRRLKEAMRDGRMLRARGDAALTVGVESGVVTAREADLVRQADAERERVIQVDAFEVGEA